MSCVQIKLAFIIITTVIRGTIENQDFEIEIIKKELLSLQATVYNLARELQKSDIRNEQLTEANIALANRLSAVEKRINEGNCSCREKNWEAKRLSPYAPNQIAFSTRLSKQLTGLNLHQTVLFDQVVSDTASAYSLQRGTFIAPITGMYVFTWTTAVRQYETTEIVVDRTIYGYATADVANDGDPDYGSASQTVVVQVSKGQHVWIRTTGGSGSLDGNMDNTFSGWLLYSLE